MNIALLTDITTGIYSMNAILTPLSHRNQSVLSIFFQYVFGRTNFDVNLVSRTLDCISLLQH